MRGRVATGPRAGQPVRRLGDRIAVEQIEASGLPCSASLGGMTLHAGVAVPAGDRTRLERLCRYAGRPPVATQRLSRRDDGRLVYRLRHSWRDGTTHVTFDPIELVERLAALVPPPRAHQVRYHGILAPAASRRDEVVPVKRSNPAPAPASDDAETKPATRYRLDWADLVQRVFAVDVTVCPRCAGSVRIIAAIRSPAAVRAILECLGLPARAPPVGQADPSLFQDPG